jgi:hypothetical protein
MPLDVVGTGLGRTGTRTLKEALQILGFGPSYHMVDLIQDRSRLRYWNAAQDGGPVDWEALFRGYRSVVDYPGCLYWRTLLREYPDAKVVHTTRDPEAWYESARATIYSVSNAPRPDATPEQLAHSAYVKRAIWEGMFGGRFEDRDHAIRCFREHDRAIQAEVPAERRIVFTVSEGWGPLCAFLGVPTPTVPFPLLNTRDEFLGRIEARAQPTK